MSLAWKKKKFVRLRKRMHPDYEKLISWTENLVANPAKTGEEMVFILMMMNSLDYPGLGAKTPSKVASSSSGPFNTWQNNLAKYQFLDEICDEIITLHDTILSSFDKNPSTPGLLNSKFSGKDIFKNKNLKDTPFLKLKTSRSMDGGILLPLLSSFRTIIEVDPTKKQVRWSADPLATWNAAKLDLMKALLGQIKTSKKVLDIRNEGNFWHLCALIVSGHATGNSTNWRSYK